MALLDRGNNPKPAYNGRRSATPAPQRLGHERVRGRPDHPGNDNRTQDFEFDHGAPELACLRGVVAPDVLRAAAHRARELDIGAEQVLIHAGAIDEEAYLQRLAAQLGIRFDRLAGHHDGAVLGAVQIAQAAATGIMPLRAGGALSFVIAPRRFGARGLAELAARSAPLDARLQLTTTRCFNALLARHGGAALAERAAHGLRDKMPALSAAPPAAARLWHKAGRMLGIAAVAGLVALPPLFADGIGTSLMAVAFLGFIGLRLLGSMVSPPPMPKRPRLPEADLPVYTLIIALYREASSVAPLMHAVDGLDYPREKLDVILVTEADDPATRAAIARLGSLPHVQVLVAPRAGPRTKPKALNYALIFARGSHVAVFDAEDRPEAGQLRAALAAFADHEPDVACVQASLCIDNAAESLLSRMFAAEYAGQFDVFLPGLAALRLPLPLGGSSNHFRRNALCEVGGWDAYNVTEDADLGIRLARFGYRSATFAATTFEEAPIHLDAWLRQRTRWMKGWMQTWSVHMRSPRCLWRDAGPRGFLAINLIVGGNVLTALTYPTLICGLVAALLSAPDAWPGFATDIRTPLHVTTIVAGYASAVAIGTLGLARRRQLRHAWILPLVPVYWGALSLAAWRALWQLLRDPYRWEKTAHGLSRRSKPFRLAQR
jgi:cellulose synthase/poly-beta-1,6-N-acetylglucosamine synthase-like glycosyltransferase